MLTLFDPWEKGHGAWGKVRRVRVRVRFGRREEGRIGVLLLLYCRYHYCYF